MWAGLHNWSVHLHFSLVPVEPFCEWKKRKGTSPALNGELRGFMLFCVAIWNSPWLSWQSEIPHGGWCMLWQYPGMYVLSTLIQWAGKVMTSCKYQPVDGSLITYQIRWCLLWCEPDWACMPVSHVWLVGIMWAGLHNWSVHLHFSLVPVEPFCEWKKRKGTSPALNGELRGFMLFCVAIWNSPWLSWRSILSKFISFR